MSDTNALTHLRLNFLPGIERLRDVCCSADSSLWLRGARYGFVIFKNTKTGRLNQAPAKAITQYRNLNREQRCVLSARQIKDFLSGDRADGAGKSRSIAG